MQERQVAIMVMLLENGVDPNLTVTPSEDPSRLQASLIEGKTYFSMCSMCSRGGEREIVQVLLDHGR